MEIAQDKLLRLKQVLEIVPVSKSKIWDDVSKGKFPKPIKLSERVTVWKLSSIENYLAGLGV